MGFHLFAKKVYDEDLYFIKSLVEEFGSAIYDVCSIQVAGHIFNEIIDKNCLRDKFNELAENGHYIITECYYNDPVKKFKYARDIWEASERIISEISLNENELNHIRSGAIRAIHKMRFNYNEKEKFIREVICSDYSDCDDDIIQIVINSFINAL